MEQLIQRLKESNKTVVFTGAGISTLSNILDFRGKNGLSNKINVEQKLSINHLNSNAEAFYKFYRENMIIPNIEPNIIHQILKELQDQGLVSYIITQNIDGLHQKAGSKNVLELHGNGNSFSCFECFKKYTVEEIQHMSLVPVCTKCGELLRPDIVLYGEKLNEYVLYEARKQLSDADNVIVLGSSLVVNPAADLIKTYGIATRIQESNKTLFIVNDRETPLDYYATEKEQDLETTFKEIEKVFCKKR